jgi:nucleotide-binding universal stress UspA family protein
MQRTVQLLYDNTLSCWKNILVPTDFSELSEQALEAAVRLAEQCEAKITLLHIIQLPNLTAVEVAPDVDELLDSSRRCLEAMAEKIPPSLLDDMLVRLETSGIAEDIIKVAVDLSVDLIIVATHGYGPFKHVLLGSVTEKVVRLSPCPVLVARKKEAKAS